jgi:hypothetical protein
MLIYVFNNVYPDSAGYTFLGFLFADFAIANQVVRITAPIDRKRA